MFPPIFALAAADVDVQALLGVNPVRFWAFADAPRDENGNIAHGTPYAVWQIISGSPENYIDTLPDMDRYGVQVDCYSQDIADARGIARALRDALEPHAYVSSWNGEWRDFPTGLYRVTFSMDFLTPRVET